MIKITLVLALLAGYIYLRAIRPLKLRWWAELLLCLPMLLTVLRYIILWRFGGPSYFAPDVPAWVLCGTAVLYIAFLIYFGAVFGGYVLRRMVLERLPAWRKLGADTQQRWYNKLHLVLIPLTLVVSGLSVCCGRAEPRLKHVSLRFPTPEPLRLAIVSDLHVSSTRSPDFVRHMVEKINAEEPDIILLLGDYVDGSPEACSEALAPLSELKAPVYGVTGNHDYYSGYARWRPVLQQLGIRMLDNEHVLLGERCPPIVLAGITDESACNFGHEGPNLDKALRGAPAGAPVLLMAHRPIVARDAAPMGVQLQLSGHLHGGLVWGLGWLIAAVDAGYRAGLYQVGAMQLYVSPGAGVSARTPMRLGVPTEVNIIDLVPQND